MTTHRYIYLSFLYFKGNMLREITYTGQDSASEVDVHHGLQ